MGPTSTVLVWELPSVGGGGKGAVCCLPWADTCISEMLWWAAEAGHVFMWEIRKALKTLLLLPSSQAVLQFDLKSASGASVSMIDRDI